MTATTGEVLAAIIRANGTADALRAARTAMTRDGGDETAPTWAAYLAALANHDAATAALTAARDSRWDDADDDGHKCHECDGTGDVYTGNDLRHICSPCAGTGYATCPDCGGDGIIPAIGCDEKYIPCTTCTN